MSTIIYIKEVVRGEIVCAHCENIEGMENWPNVGDTYVCDTCGKTSTITQEEWE